MAQGCTEEKAEAKARQTQSDEVFYTIATSFIRSGVFTGLSLGRNIFNENIYNTLNIDSANEFKGNTILPDSTNPLPRSDKLPQGELIPKAAENTYENMSKYVDNRLISSKPLKDKNKTPLLKGEFIIYSHFYFPKYASLTALFESSSMPLPSMVIFPVSRT